MGRIQQALERIYRGQKELGKTSQVELARKIGVSKGQAHHLITGERRLNEDNLLAIINALGVTLADVALAAGDMPSGRVATISEEAPKDLRAAFARMEALYRANPRAFQSVARTIDDWLIDAEDPEEKTPIREVS
jgi:transcriptional regulator with XRE-family HTH domain